MMQEKALACDVRLHAPSESVFLQSTLQSLTMCVCLYHLTFLGSYQPLREFSWRKKKEKARQKGSGFIDKFLTWVSGLPRSTATPIHHFVQYAKVTLLEISPCQGPTVKRSGVAYPCSYALLVWSFSLLCSVHKRKKKFSFYRSQIKLQPFLFYHM